MTNSQVMDVMHSGILVAVKLAGPMLILSMGIGVLIAILQAATQIHEQTLSFVPKLILYCSDPTSLWWYNAGNHARLYPRVICSDDWIAGKGSMA